MSGTCRIGSVITLPEVTLAELLGASLDLAWIDLEHGALGLGEVPGLAIALKAAGCQAHVRVPSWDSALIGPVADAGVDGVVVPDVESAPQAEEVVRRLRYPPRGVRGFGPRRAGGYGRTQAASFAPSLTVQVESPVAVEAAGGIAAVDGVDAVVVGCADLTLRLGAPGELDQPELVAAVQAVATAAQAHDRRFGLAGGGDLEALGRLAPAGCDFLVHSVDVRLYARAIDEANALVRRALRREAVIAP